MLDLKPPSFQYTSHVLTRSQTKNPELLLDVLVATSVKENWISLLINLHTVIFFALILLTSGFGISNSLQFVSVHMLVLLIAGVISVSLFRLPEAELLENTQRTAWWLVISDAILSTGWGLSIVLLFNQTPFDRFDTLIILLFAIGICTAALSAKLLKVLIIGRILVFLPIMLYLFAYQPSEWLLHIASIFICFIFTIGIGYAIHIQFLREATLVVEINEARAQTVKEAAFRERFLRSITHDLLQPLSSIKLFVRGLRHSEPSIAERVEIQSIDACLVSANEILDNVAQLAWITDQLPAPNLGRVKLDDVLGPLTQIYRLRAAEKGLNLNYVKSSLSAHTETSYLERAVRNLLENAIEYTDKGRILVGVRNRISSNKIEIQVMDTGHGLEQEHWQRVFEEYQRLDNSIDTQKGHLGLGLSIVRSVAQSLKGSVTISSVINKGSCFGLVLPASKSDDSLLSLSAEREDLHEFENTKINTVLIIDDDSVYAQFLSKVLTELGLITTVISKRNDIQAMSEKSLPETDFYVVDYHLGENLNGLELLAKTPFKSKNVLVSHFDNLEIRNLASSSETPFLKKSTDPQRMSSLLKDLLGL